MSPLAREILGGGVPSRTCSILPTGKRRWARAARVSSGDTGTVRRLCVVHALRRLLGVLRACQGAVGCRGRKSERARRKYFFAYAFLRSNVHRRWAMNRTASSQNCARESAPPMLVFAQRKKTRMQRFFLVFYGHLVSALQLKLFLLVVPFFISNCRIRTRMVVGWWRNYLVMGCHSYRSKRLLAAVTRLFHNLYSCDYSCTTM